MKQSNNENIFNKHEIKDDVLKDNNLFNRNDNDKNQEQNENDDPFKSIENNSPYIPQNDQSPNNHDPNHSSDLNISPNQSNKQENLNEKNVFNDTFQQDDKSTVANKSLIQDKSSIDIQTKSHIDLNDKSSLDLYPNSQMNNIDSMNESDQKMYPVISNNDIILDANDSLLDSKQNSKLLIGKRSHNRSYLDITPEQSRINITPMRKRNQFHEKFEEKKINFLKDSIDKNIKMKEQYKSIKDSNKLKSSKLSSSVNYSAVKDIAIFTDSQIKTTPLRVRVERQPQNKLAHEFQKDLDDYINRQTLHKSLTQDQRTNFKRTKVEKIPFLTYKEVMRLVEAQMKDLEISPIKSYDSMFAIINNNFNNGMFTLNDMGLKDQSLLVLSEILKGKDNLYSLDLTCNKVGISNIEQLLSLINSNQNLTEIILNSNNITHSVFSLLIDGIVTSQHITSLSLMNSVTKQKNVFNLKNVSNFDSLLSCKTLKMLNLANIKIADEGVSIIARNIECSFITQLNISSCHITDDCASKIAFIISSSHLVSLDLSNNSFTHSGIRKIAKVFESERNGVAVILEKLNLSGCKLKYDSINELFDCMRANTVIKELRLNNNDQRHIDNRNIKIFLNDNISLKELQMQECELTSRDVTMMIEGMKNNSTLTHLHISKNNADSSIFYYMDMWLASNQKLIMMDLSSNRISSEKEDIGYLIDFLNKNSKLRELNLQNNHITDVKLIISNLEKINQLTKLHLGKNPLALEDIQLINEKMDQNNKNYLNHYEKINKEKIQKIKVAQIQYRKLESELDSYKILKDDGHLRNDSLADGYEQIIAEEEAKFLKCVDEMEEAKSRSQNMEKEMLSNKEMYENNKVTIFNRNKTLMKKLNDLKKKKTEAIKKSEDSRENQDNKKRLAEIELAETHKKFQELEKYNTLLSVQLQGLKFDIDQLNGAVSVMKNASAVNKEQKKLYVNKTSIAKTLSKNGNMN